MKHVSVCLDRGAHTKAAMWTCGELPMGHDECEVCPEMGGANAKAATWAFGELFLFCHSFFLKHVPHHWPDPNLSRHVFFAQAATFGQRRF